MNWYPSKFAAGDLATIQHYLDRRAIQPVQLHEIVQKIVTQERQRRRRNAGELPGPITGPQMPSFGLRRVRETELRKAIRTLLGIMIAAESRAIREFAALMLQEIHREMIG